MALTPESRSLALTLIEGAAKTIVNADELFDEARLLAGAGHIARALLLHQISLEECGKAEMLHVSVSEVLRGQRVDLKQLVRVFSKHAAKNKTNAYFLPRSDAELGAITEKDTSAAVAAFNELQEQFHENSNDLKNASLYVDFDGKFLAPREVIAPADLDDILQRNGMFMAMAMDKLAILMRWRTDLDAAAAEVAELWTTLGFNTLDRTKPETLEVLLKRIEEMFGAAAKRALPEGA